MAGDEAESRRWQAAVGLIAVWWTTREESRPDVLARRLDELTADGSALTVEEAALALVDVAGMFAELYADRMGMPLDEILAEAALVSDVGADGETEPSSADGAGSGSASGSRANAEPSPSADSGPGDPSG